MRMQNPFAAKEFGAANVIVGIWLVIATVLGVLYLKGELYDSLYQKGFQRAVDTLLQNAEGCDPITVTRSNNKVNLINIECLKAKDEVGEGADVSADNVSSEDEL